MCTRVPITYMRMRRPATGEIVPDGYRKLGLALFCCAGAAAGRNASAANTEVDEPRALRRAPRQPSRPVPTRGEAPAAAHPTYLPPARHFVSITCETYLPRQQETRLDKE
ncbi:unnamed protein product, partial [Brenthis ino]